MRKSLVKQNIKKIAISMGFTLCGVAKAQRLDSEEKKLESWLAKGYQGKMGYLERYFEERLDPRKLVYGAKSILSLAYNYFPKKILEKQNSPKIAKYAYGEDYHFVIKEKLRKLMDSIKVLAGNVSGRYFVDSAPVHERAWATKSGIGWTGKNTLTLNKNQGSYFFLSEVIMDLELDADTPIKNYCGTCTACIDACPTQALHRPFELNASQCISYLTIELKEEIPSTFKNKMNDWVFGCDICQDVCPWNRFSKPHNEPRFEPKNWPQMNVKDWYEMTENAFSKIFTKSAVKRTKYGGLMRNLAFLKSNDEAKK